MALYVPTAFASRDAVLARQLIDAHPFATLITTVDGAAPQISHLPMLLDGDGDALLGHLARANPHWQRFEAGHTLAVFHGPHAYISPTAYEKPEAGVPTWNYATVHVEGCPALLDDAAAAALLDRLTARFEPDGHRTATEVVARMLGGIVAFRMPIARLTPKFKMSQNRSAADRAGVMAALEATGRADERAVARWMRTHAAA